MEFIYARFSGIWHWLKGHEVEWVANTDEVCAGDIYCHTCRLGIWCRWYDPKWLGGGKDLND